MIWLCVLILWWIIILKFPTSYWSWVSKSAVVIAFSATAMVMVYQYTATWYPRKCVGDAVLLRVGPDESYGVCGQVDRAAEVIVYQEQHGWSKVGHMRLIGWIESDKLVASGSL